MKKAVLSVLVGVGFVTAGTAGQTLLNYTGDNRFISVSGVAGGIDGSNSYSQTKVPPAPYAAFDESVYGVADWQDTTPWYPGQEPGGYHAESGAFQKSELGANSMVGSNRVWGSDWVSLQGPYGPANPVAANNFQVTFELTVPVQFELTLELWAGNFSTWPNHDRGTPSLFAADELELLPVPITPGHYVGTLDPGSYTLLITQGFSLPADPFGQMIDVGYNMNFAVTPVPEPSVAALLGLGVIALLRFRRQARA